MVARILLKLVFSLAAAACALTSSAVRAEDGPTVPQPTSEPAAVAAEPPPRNGEGPSLEVRAPVDAFFTSNLFHVQDRRVAGFDGNSGPGERFDGIGALWDAILHPGARATLEIPTGRKRDLELEMGADYYLHQRNPIADYLRLTAEGAVDVTRHDELAVGAKYVPRRFTKNHRDPDAVWNADATFEHDYVGEVDVEAGYEHEWSKSFAGRLEYQLEREVHDAPFQNRDQLGHEGRAFLLLGGKGTRISLGAGLGVSASPGGVEKRRNPLDPYDPLLSTVDVVVDRSFRDSVILGGASFDSSTETELEAALEIRSRNFTSGNQEDATYFGRSDRRIKLEVGLKRKVGRGLSLEAFAAFTRNYSNRSDPDVAADEVGYKELVVGAAATWRVSMGGR